MAGWFRGGAFFWAWGPVACARVTTSGRKARNIRAMPARTFLLRSGCMGCLLVAKLSGETTPLVRTAKVESLAELFHGMPVLAGIVGRPLSIISRCDCGV